LTKIPRATVSGLSVRSGSKATAQDIAISSVQDARNAMKTHTPRGERWK
jgi:hypothetical protein